VIPNSRLAREIASLGAHGCMGLRGPLLSAGELIIYVEVANNVRTQHTVTEKRAMTGGGTIE
jgi:hypothetical protein